MMTETRYFVLYRSGGTDWCRWTRLLDRYSIKEANAKRDELMRMGYASLVQSVEQIDRMGMPYGWTYNSVNWEEDEITTENDRNGVPWRTTHIKAMVTA